MNSFVERLKAQMEFEFKNQIRNGVYGFTQRTMAYNSNKIEGSTLTERETASIFETGTIVSDNSEVIYRTKDIEEMTGHFRMFNFMMRTLDKSLSEDIIKGMHYELKAGVFEDYANGYAIGDYKRRKNIVGDIDTSSPENVSSDMAKLIKKYNSKEEINIEDIAEFHCEFETIHPFQDGNGRVGRIIMLRECLIHGLIPIVIQDRNKPVYYRGLREAQKNKNLDDLIKFLLSEQKVYENQTKEFIYDYMELKAENKEKKDSVK